MRPAIVTAVTIAVAVIFACLVSPAWAAGDAAHGADVFKRCAICHRAGKGAGNGLGPNLFGVAGRKAASLPGFNYSGALKASGITWNDARLLAWISGPQRLVPGNRMAFPGVTNPRDAADVVAYLDSLK